MLSGVCWAEPGIPPARRPVPANDMVLCLPLGCLGQELSDREAPAAPADQGGTLRGASADHHSPGDPASFQPWATQAIPWVLLPPFTWRLCSLPSTSTFIVGPEGHRWGPWDPKGSSRRAQPITGRSSHPGRSTGASGLHHEPPAMPTCSPQLS